MSVTQIDHQAEVDNRIVTQFKESTNLINYIKSLLSEANDLEVVYQDLCNKRWIDTAEGKQLDILGEIVGQPRGFKQDVAQTFFGFKGAIGADTFGTAGTPSAGSVFKSVSDVEFIDVVFDDTTYRVFIRAKAAKNKTKVTINEVIDVILQGITGATTVVVSETQASFKLTFNVALSDSDKLLLARSTFAPKPAGVNVIFADIDGVFL